MCFCLSFLLHVIFSTHLRAPRIEVLLYKKFLKYKNKRILNLAN
jgi:hypothetical protein